MAKRYQRSQLYEPPGVSMAGADTAQQLSQALAGFRRQVVDWTLQARGREGAQAGAAEALAGQFRRKSDFTAYGQAYNNAALNTIYAEQASDIEANFDRLEREHPSDAAGFAAAADGFESGMLSKVPAEIRPRVQLLIHAKRVDSARRVQHQADLIERDRRRTVTVQGLDALARMAAGLQADDGEIASRAFDTIATQVRGTLEQGVNEGLWLPSEAYALGEEYIEGIEKGARHAKLEAAINHIEGLYRTDFLAGDRALRELEGVEMDPADKDVIRSEMRSRVNLLQDERRRQYVQQIGDLHQDIADGTPPDDAEERAFGLWRAGAIEVGQYTALLDHAGRARIEAAQRGAQENAALRAFLAGQPLDPRDSNARKGMDTLFAAQVTGQERGSAAWQNAAIEMARRTNIVPSDAVAWARAVATAGDVEGAANASAFLSRLEDANPAAYAYFDDPQLQAFASQVNDAMHAGAPSDVAVQVAQRNAFGLQDSDRKAYEDSYRRSKAAQGNAAALQGLLDSDDRYDRRLFGGAPQASIALQGEFETSVARYYPFTGGDLEAARALAFRDVTRSWGYSTVNGAPELLKWAPEAMYPGLTSAVIRADLAQSLRGLVADPAKVRLVPDATTAHTQGRVWGLAQLDEYGAPAVVRGVDGQALRYELPIAQEAYERTRKTLADEAIAQARRTTESRRRVLEVYQNLAEMGDSHAALLLLLAPQPAPGIKADGAASLEETADATP